GRLKMGGVGAAPRRRWRAPARAIKNPAVSPPRDVPRQSRSAEGMMVVRPRLRRRHVLAVASLAVVSACRPPLGSVPAPNRVVAPLSQVSTSGKTTPAPAPTDAPALPSVASAAPPTPLPPTSTPVPPTAIPSVPTPFATLTSAAVATPAPVVPPLVAGRPGFSEVSQATPSDVVAFLAGRHPLYPGSNASKV